MLDESLVVLLERGFFFIAGRKKRVEKEKEKLSDSAFEISDFKL